MPAGSHCSGTLFRSSPDSPGILQDEQGQAEQQDRQCTENRHRKGKRPVVPEAFTAHVGKPHQAIRRHGRSQPDNRDQDLRHVHRISFTEQLAETLLVKKMGVKNRSESMQRAVAAD